MRYSGLKDRATSSGMKPAQRPCQDLKSSRFVLVLNYSYYPVYKAAGLLDSRRNLGQFPSRRADRNPTIGDAA